MEMKHAVALRHVAFEDLGSLEPLLLEEGYAVEYLEAGYHDLASSRAAECALLVILGGPISVNDTADYPFLAQEERIVRHRLERDLPTLGICLGAQLIAKVLGARVYKGPASEIGWGSLKRSGPAPNEMDALLHPEINVLHWHGETFDLPQGAVRLASTDAYENQAFSYGKRCLGLQFHAEATQRGLERWLIGHCGEIASSKSVTLPQLRSDAARHAATLAAASRRFFTSWLHRVAIP